MEVKKSNTAQDINFINNDDDNDSNDNGKIYIFYYSVYIYIYIYRVFDNCGDSFHRQLQRTKLRRKVL